MLSSSAVARGPVTKKRKIISGQHQFTGNYLDASWTQQFILGFVLQTYQAVESKASAGSSSSGVSVLSLQQELSEKWNLSVKPLDAVSTNNILTLLGRYATGQGVLSLEAIELLNSVLSRLGHGDLEDPRNVVDLLHKVGFVEPGDNIRRLVFKGDLSCSTLDEAAVVEHVDKPTDVFDDIRDVVDEPVYAIDSATTSEVDDAIGVHVDGKGVEWFTVYVSDATVHCPFDSLLERATARTMTTTLYLPEQVFFMLPKPIVEAATLRDDRPCRTFNITFRIHPERGHLFDYRVHVGWVNKLRRITYDAVQQLYDHSSASPMSQTPAWVTAADITKLHRILEVARLRMATRMASAKNKIESNLPDPLVKVRGTKVVSVTDQVLSTKDARIAVAELMIAANEVCSRVAQAHKICIPYRGTRVLSRDHELAKAFEEPDGVAAVEAAAPAPSLSRTDDSTAAPVVVSYFAQAMFRNISALSSVTRAVYFHEPIHHTGLDTVFYSHSTSPLRRYADMLLHHQLKVFIAHQCGKRVEEEYIPEYQMATLCSMISTKQEAAAILQDASTRYWILRYIWMTLLDCGRQPARLLQCLVGSTRDVSASPAYGRGCASEWPGHTQITQCAVQSKKKTCPYVSDVYIPELQITHVLYHDRVDARVGTTLSCRVARIEPDLNLLELDIVSVAPFEASTEEIMRQALLPAADS